MIRFFLLFLLITSAFSSTIERSRWINGETFLVFLEKNNLPLKSLYYNLDKDDQRLTEELRAGVHYQIAKDKNNTIEQVLLPLNDELQIHIYKKNAQEYKFEAIPIISTTKTEAFSTSITSSPNYNILKETGSKKLAQIFVSSFKHSLNFKNNIRKGDRLVMIYEQKYRLGQVFSMPTLKVAMIEMHHKKHYIYLNKDDRYYDEKGHEVEGFLLARPVKARISSYFTKRRWHPILHKWKAHLGIDYAARRGTPIVAAGRGTVIWAKRMGSYGNLIKIRHADGYETRYAHLKSFRRGIHRGKRVKKGQTIGYVGTTGRSTGPHLHFELRKHGRAINPLSVVQVTTKKLYGKQKRAFLKLKKSYDKAVETQLENKEAFVKPPKFQNECYLNHGVIPHG